MAEIKHDSKTAAPAAESLRTPSGDLRGLTTVRRPEPDQKQSTSPALPTDTRFQALRERALKQLEKRASRPIAIERGSGTIIDRLISYLAYLLTALDKLFFGWLARKLGIKQPSKVVIKKPGSDENIAINVPKATSLEGRSQAFEDDSSGQRKKDKSTVP